MLDWQSRVLLGVTSAASAFALCGFALQQPLHIAGATEVAAVSVVSGQVEAAGEHVVPIPDFALQPATDPAEAPAATPPTERPPPITIALAGDVHGEPPIAGTLAAGDNPLAGVASLLIDADIAVVNLETAIGTAGTPADKAFVFRADPALAPALADAGVDVVTMANNHALDFGTDAAAGSAALLHQANVATVGFGADAAAAYAPEVLTIHGRTVAIIGLSRVLPSLSWAATGSRAGLASAYDVDAAVAAVRAAATVADHVVVMIHWGRERWVCPDKQQLELARALAAAGADVIAGHHPHVLQGTETIGRTLVAYSLGNFAFYARSPATRQTGVLTVTLGDDGVLDHRWNPAEIDGMGQPWPVATQAPTPLDEPLTATAGGRGCGPPT